MANNYRQGIYTIKNVGKYVGKNKPRYRSGWEMTFMMFLDNNDNIINWASESISIPYRNPFTGRDTFYVPDFFVVYQKDGVRKAELVEIKPKGQAVMEMARSQQEKAAVALNMVKWAAARAWCKQMGATFRVLTEEDIYNNTNPTKKRRK